ncbi:MAG: hypothetical protein JWQ70_3108 [Aeromicrobium sp.]|nr:hypothetical protein [Aeromicrobium sp.]
MRKVLLFLSAFVLCAAPLTAAHASGHYTVTVKLNHTTITKGATVTISGKVTGGPVSGKKVSITAFEGPDDDLGTANIGHASLSGSGKYSKTWTPPTAGSWTIKVTKSSSGSVAGDSTFTSIGALKVYRWMSLVNTYDAGNSTGEQGPTSGLTVNGTTYPHEFYVGPTGTLDLDVHGLRCTSLLAWVGVWDSSATGLTAAGVVKQGSHVVDQRIKRQGDAATHIRRAINSSYHLKVTAIFGVDDFPDWVFADPKGYCATP